MLTKIDLRGRARLSGGSVRSCLGHRDVGIRVGVGDETISARDNRFWCVVASISNACCRRANVNDECGNLTTIAATAAAANFSSGIVADFKISGADSPSRALGMMFALLGVSVSMVLL